MPDASMIPTGIQGLDTQLGGGVPPGSVILVLGESTNAWFTFMEEFAAQGVRSGATVQWVELDRSGSHVVRDVSRFTDGGEAANLSVLDASGAAAEGPGVAALGVDAVQDQVLAAVGAGGARVVLSSVTTLLDHMEPQVCLQFLRDLVREAAASGSIAMVSVVSNAHDDAFMARLKHAASGVMEIGLERKGFGLYSFLKIEKLLGVAEAAKLLLFSESDKGLRLESTRRVF